MEGLGPPKSIWKIAICQVLWKSFAATLEKMYKNQYRKIGWIYDFPTVSFSLATNSFRQRPFSSPKSDADETEKKSISWRSCDETNERFRWRDQTKTFLLHDEQSR